MNGFGQEVTVKLDVSKMTRVQAERAVAATRDPETLKALGDHKNKHVRAKAAYKYARLETSTADAAGPSVEGASS